MSTLGLIVLFTAFSGLLSALAASAFLALGEAIDYETIRLVVAHAAGGQEG